MKIFLNLLFLHCFFLFIAISCTTSTEGMAPSGSSGNDSPTNADYDDYLNINGAWAGDRFFSFPKGIDVDSDGNLYISDSYNHRVQKWSSNGNYIGWIGYGRSGWQTGEAPGRGYANRNSCYGCINDAGALALDAEGNIYVVGTQPFQKWSVNGNIIGWLGGNDNGWYTGEFNSNYTCNIDNGVITGTYPETALRSVGGFAITNENTIYFAVDNALKRWNLNGNYTGWTGHGNVTAWSTEDSRGFWCLDMYTKAPTVAPGNFNYHHGVAVDSQGSIFVVDTFNHRVQKFSSNGNFMGWIGGGSDGWQTGDAPSAGAIGDRQFYKPFGVDIDSSDNIYVADTSNNRVQKWTSAGAYVGWIGYGSDTWMTGNAPGCSGMGETQWGSSAMCYPEDLAIDAAGNIYVSNYSYFLVKKYSSNGNYQGFIGYGADGWRNYDDIVAQYGSNTNASVPEGW